jgi:hypothetical protein
MCPESPINQVQAGEDKPQKVEGKQNAALSNYCCAEDVLLQSTGVTLLWAQQLFCTILKDVLNISL